MAKIKVGIARPCTGGVIHQNVASFISNAVETRFTDEWCRRNILELIDFPIDRFPTDVARNLIVQAAQRNEVDYLFMIDSDGHPDFDFFKSALQFLTKQKTPSVIGAPYMSGDGEVQVYRFIPQHSNDPQEHDWKLSRVVRADAFQRTGVEQVASIGTHCICYDMRVFDEITKPYFRYSYSPDHTVLTETEEMYAHRSMSTRNIPIFCDWGRWAGHYKQQEVGPLKPIPPDVIPEFWKQKAREYYLYSDEGRAELEKLKGLNEQDR